MTWIQEQEDHVMPATATLARITHEATQWDEAFYAFLAEKERRSGSLRTVQSYSRMLQHFFAGTGKTPDQLGAPEVFGWAHGVGLSGRHPSSVTVGPASPASRRSFAS